MSTWVVGDIQGCFPSFMQLLIKIEFNPLQDRLWLVGDLVNRGDYGLEVLEYLYKHKESVRIVLGNHDIALIAAYFGLKNSNPTIEPILRSNDVKNYIDWLRSQPFVHIDYNLGYAMAHAGIAPNLELGAAKVYSQILQDRLQSANVKEWLKAMLSMEVNYFNPEGGVVEQERYLLSSFTRMRYCYSDGRLDFKQKGSPKELKNPNLYPWFDCPSKIDKELKIIFGHWSTLGFLNRDDILATDTGCIWNGKLTAVSLPDERVVSVNCNNGLEPR